MTKEQLIKSAVETSALDNMLYWILAILVATLIAAVGFVLSFDFSTKFSFKHDFKYIVLVLVIVLFCLVAGTISRKDILIDKLTNSEESRQENFYGNYLESIEPEKIYVKDIVLGNEGYTVALDNDKPQKLLFVKDFEFINSGNSYVEAIWVDGLEEINIADGYYNIKLYKSDDLK